MHTGIEKAFDAIEVMIAATLRQCEVSGPPIDARAVARGLGLEVRLNRQLQERGRIVDSRGRATIVVRPEPRSERYQWTIAHEIGEYLIPRMSDVWEGEIGSLDASLREWLANRFATRLLTPNQWFLSDARGLDYDLMELKRLYVTASFEVIAMRLLDAEIPTIITIFDNGSITRRMGNLTSRPPALFDLEKQCRQKVLATREAASLQGEYARTQAWPIDENGWQREIMRTELLETFDG